MKGNSAPFSGQSPLNLTSPSPHKVDDSVAVAVPTGYSFLTHVVANVGKEWLGEIRKAPPLCSDAMVEGYDAVSRFLKPTEAPGILVQPLSKERCCVFSSRNGLTVQL